MSGYRITLDIAKGALAASQSSLAVTGHNISNLSTLGYSRQTVTATANSPMTVGGLQFGRGVDLEAVLRKSDGLLEQRLLEQRSLLAADEEAIGYVKNLEALFDIQSEFEMSQMIAEFWNTWHDLSNNPSGVSERAVVFEFGKQISERLTILSEDLRQLETHISQEIETGIGQLNDILEQIASLNLEINQVENSGRFANDQRDKRGQLLVELNELMSVNSIEHADGFMTVMTDDGYPLVIKEQAYPLEVADGRVQWMTSSGGQIDISDSIDTGKISGWLDMKEEEVTKYRVQIDSLAKELIWQVNYQHSQGVGLKYFANEQSGTYAPVNIEGGPLSTLSFGNKIDYTKDFKMWTRDANDPPNAVSVEVDMGVSDTNVTYVGGGAASADAKYYFTVTTSGTVGPGADDPVITWQTADYSTVPPGPVGGGGTVTIGASGAGNFVVDGMTFTIDPGYLVAGNTFTVNTSAGNVPTPLSITNDPTLTANSVLDNYIFTVASGGGDVTAVSQANPMVIQWENSHQIGTLTLDDPADLTFEVDGMSLTFNSGVLFDGDAFSINTDQYGYQIDDAGNFSIETSSEWHWTVQSFADQFNTQSTAGGANITAFVNLDGSLRFTPSYGISYAFSDDMAEDSGLMAALGMNTFFEGDSANNISVNEVLSFVDNIAAAKIDGGETNGMISDDVINDPSVTNLTISPGNANNTLRFEENGISHTITLNTVTYTSVVDLNSLAADLQTQMNAASTLGPPATFKVEYNEADNQFVISESDGSNVDNLEIFWSENPGTATALGYKPIDKVYLPPYGDYGVSNNANSLSVADIQYTEIDIAKWNFKRGTDPSSETVNIHIEGYYQDMLSGLGVKGASLESSLEFGDIIVEQLSELREAVSGVSIDEEMIKLITYQQSYTAASKLITTIDEMLNTLMAVK